MQLTKRVLPSSYCLPFFLLIRVLYRFGVSFKSPPHNEEKRFVNYWHCVKPCTNIICVSIGKPVQKSSIKLGACFIFYSSRLSTRSHLRIKPFIVHSLFVRISIPIQFVGLLWCRRWTTKSKKIVWYPLECVLNMSKIFIHWKERL